jgi:hypothetical protein
MPGPVVEEKTQYLSILLALFLSIQDVNAAEQPSAARSHTGAGNRSSSAWPPVFAEKSKPPFPCWSLSHKLACIFVLPRQSIGGSTDP